MEKKTTQQLNSVCNRPRGINMPQYLCTSIMHPAKTADFSNPGYEPSHERRSTGLYHVAGSGEAISVKDEWGATFYSTNRSLRL
jgi:hypothetical protein